MTDDRAPYDDRKRQAYQRDLGNGRLRRDQLRALGFEIFFDLDRADDERQGLKIVNQALRAENEWLKARVKELEGTDR